MQLLEISSKENFIEIKKETIDFKMKTDFF